MLTVTDASPIVFYIQQVFLGAGYVCRDPSLRGHTIQILNGAVNTYTRQVLDELITLFISSYYY